MTGATPGLRHAAGAAVLAEEGEDTMLILLHLFVRPKVRIALLTLAVYASLC